jgi:polar amino acid transport system substrate-binding protein
MTANLAIRTNRTLFFCLAWLGLSLMPAQAGTLEKIKERGTLIVGVKGDVKPWGFLQSPGTEPVGIEPELAKTISDAIGVKLKLIPLSSEQRVNALRTGTVDILIATFSDTPQRREQVRMVGPHYLWSGVNLMSRKQDHFRSWSELRDRRVCGRYGSFFNRSVVVTYGVDVVPFYSLLWAKRAVLEGRCSALLHDDLSILSELQDAPWSKDFEMAMPTLFYNFWSVAIPLGNEGDSFAQSVSDQIVQWHRQGIVEKQLQKWNVAPPEFTRKMKTVWTRKNADGSWYCGERLSDTTPKECVTPLTIN